MRAQSTYNASVGETWILKLSGEEYLAVDEVTEIPSEFHGGEMFPIEVFRKAPDGQ